MQKKLSPIGNIHHAAIRCRDAEQTRSFYEDILGLKLAIAFEDSVDFGEGFVRNFCHLFFEMGDGNFLAFFDQPDVSEESNFKRKDSFDLHIALEVDSLEDLLAWHKEINEKGKTCLGPIDHGFVQSIYMHDPNGIQVELTCRAKAGSADANHHFDNARENLNKWTEKTRELKLSRFGEKKLKVSGT